MKWFSLKYEKNKLILIDQRLIPNQVKYVGCLTYEDVIYAIKEMVVRGAPAIGIAGAYGYYLGYCKRESMALVRKALIGARPTAVNLEWAVVRMDTLYRKLYGEGKSEEEIDALLLAEAHAIHQEDVAMNHQMALMGAEVVPEDAGVLTHCNTGALATSEHGTALGVIRTAYEQGKIRHVYADETRPRLQGAKLTAFELVTEGIESTLIPDSAAAVLMDQGAVDIVLVGADRIVLNGDTANKIGTFNVSILAKHFNIPFYIVAPTSTIDFTTETGAEIVIEERSKEEVTMINGIKIAPEGIGVFNPSFDVTPQENITGIITEVGIIKPPFRENLLKLKETLK